jgi:alkane 1-monooxygenase
MAGAAVPPRADPYVPSPWPFLVSWLIPVSVVVGSMIGALWSFLTVLVVFGALPALDLLLGRDTRNPDERDVEALTERKAFRYITWAWVPLQVALLVFALLHARHGLPLEEWLGTAASA